MFAELAVHTVKSPYRLILMSASYYHLASGNLVRIEGVKRLTELEKNEIGHVHDIVLRIDSDTAKPVLKPFR